MANTAFITAAEEYARVRFAAVTIHDVLPEELPDDYEHIKAFEDGAAMFRKEFVDEATEQSGMVTLVTIPAIGSSDELVINPACEQDAGD